MKAIMRLDGGADNRVGQGANKSAENGANENDGANQP